MTCCAGRRIAPNRCRERDLRIESAKVWSDLQAAEWRQIHKAGRAGVVVVPGLAAGQAKSLAGGQAWVVGWQLPRAEAWQLARPGWWVRNSAGQRQAWQLARPGWWAGLGWQLGRQEAWPMAAGQAWRLAPGGRWAGLAQPGRQWQLGRKFKERLQRPGTGWQAVAAASLCSAEAWQQAGEAFGLPSCPAASPPPWPAAMPLALA